MQTARYELPIKELFKILDLDDIKYNYPVGSDVDIKIQGPDSYIPIQAFVKKYHNVAKYIFDNDESLICSTEHIVFENGTALQINKCSFVDTLTDKLVINGVDYLGQAEVYDVSLNYPHTYITPNNILHHNTTLAKLLFNELDIDEYDILEINASRENGVDTIREKIINFSQTMPFGDFKVILLDEADGLTVQGQNILRGVMEAYASSCRFILTCNYPSRIIPALHSRCQGFHIDKVDQTEFTARIATILIEEDVEMDLDTLDTYIKVTYPDLRKCINLVQQNTKDGVLQSPRKGEGAVDDYKITMIEMFKDKRYREGRKLVMSQCRQDEAEDLWTWLIDNYKIFSDDEDVQEKIILYIRKGMCNHPVSIDPILNIAATLIEIGNVSE